MKNKHLRHFFNCTLWFAFLGCFCWPAVAQSNQWAWIKGSDTTNQAGVYGTQGIAAVANTPGARYSSVSSKDKTGNLWLFGGFVYPASNSAGHLNDLWKYDINTGNWAWIKGSNNTGIYNPGIYGTQGIAAVTNTPGARGYSISWTDNNGNMWVFGGGGYPVGTPGSLNDLWKYDVLTGNWTWMKGNNTSNQVGIYGTRGTSASANTPGARERSTSWTDTSGNLWLFGGDGYANTNTSTGNLNDLWKYDIIITGNWTWIKGSNVTNQTGVYGTQGTAAATNTPGAREKSVSWTDKSGNLWLFGGDIFITPNLNSLNDLWKYDITSGNWTWMKGSNVINQTGIYGTQGIASIANTPGARNGSISWTDNSGNLWLFGGGGYSANGLISLNDLWKYDIASGNWTWMKGSNSGGQSGIYGILGIAAPANTPGGRTLSISWTDNSGNLWLFGGSGSRNDLWKYYPNNSLPLTLTDFVATKQNNASLLNWKVATEQNIANYTIERSNDGRSFTSIGEVTSLGNTSSIRNYQFTDAQLLKGANYYRLKIIEKDGKISYSEIRLLNFGSQISLAVLPNPAKEKVTILGVETGMQIRLINARGQIITTQQATGNTANFSLNNVPSGIYQVQVNSATGKLLSTARLVKE